MIYVDELRRWGPRARRETCHMTADTLPELRAFAERLGIPRKLRHYGASTPHYDLPAEWRERVLREPDASFVPARAQARKRLRSRA